MTITKNDFFTANNFETLQDISKKYSEWKDFCMEIVNQMDDKFGQTKINDTHTDFKMMQFYDSRTIKNWGIEGLQEDTLYIMKQYVILEGDDGQEISKELYNTGVYIGQTPNYKYNANWELNGKQQPSITLQSDVTYNVGDVLISFDATIPNDGSIRYDYNGALFEVYKVDGTKVDLVCKDEISNNGFQDITGFFLYKKAK